MSANPARTFRLQRLSAMALIPLALWFLYSLVVHAGDDYAAARAWLGEPLTKLLLGGFVTVGAAHGRIGVAEIVDDYFYGDMRKGLSAAATVFAFATVAAVWIALYHL